MIRSGPIKVVVKELNQVLWRWPAPCQTRGSQICAARARAVHSDPSQQLRSEIRQDACKFFRTLRFPTKDAIGEVRYRRRKHRIRAQAPHVASKHFHHCIYVFGIFVRPEFRIIEVSTKKIMARLAYAY
jgi:hypothetical protein